MQKKKKKPVGSGDLSKIGGPGDGCSFFCLFVCLFSDQFLTGMRYQAKL